LRLGGGQDLRAQGGGHGTDRRDAHDRMRARSMAPNLGSADEARLKAPLVKLPRRRLCFAPDIREGAMDGFSVGKAIGAGFRLIGRHPAAVLVWMLVYLAIGVLPHLGVMALILPQWMGMMQEIASSAA